MNCDYLAGQTIETIYFGGGTPSLLTAAEINALLETIQQHYRVAPLAEITLEANPDDMDREKMLAWKQQGINRLSIGVQSFVDADLQWMNRAHNASQSVACIKTARDCGFQNLTIDLIYGSPTLTHDAWAANIDTALALQIPHLSCYALTVEPQTALQKMIAQQKKDNVDSEAQAQQFLFLMEKMQEAGYAHYEISNYALPGFESRHNSAYWEGTHYLGIGPSAHSFNGVSRQWNVSNNAQYAAALQKGELLFETETLSPVQQLNEYIMIRLRTARGLDLETVATRWGAEKTATLEKNSLRYLASGHIKMADKHLILTRQGKLFADGIAADLFFSEQA
jgi:oxygen-independent coproporphyrinogen III oxidase